MRLFLPGFGMRPLPDTKKDLETLQSHLWQIQRISAHVTTKVHSKWRRHQVRRRLLLSEESHLHHIPWKTGFCVPDANDDLSQGHYPTSTCPWHSIKPCSVINQPLDLSLSLVLSLFLLQPNTHTQTDLIILFGPRIQIKPNQRDMNLTDQVHVCSRLQKPLHIIEIGKAEAWNHRR